MFNQLLRLKCHVDLFLELPHPIPWLPPSISMTRLEIIISRPFHLPHATHGNSQRLALAELDRRMGAPGEGIGDREGPRKGSALSGLDDFVSDGVAHNLSERMEP